jgi:hypothetical protein
MQAKFRPLRWAGPSTPSYERRSRSAFKAPWQSTLTLLYRELDHLDARDLVIEADFSESDIRLDGMPRANARQPQHPGVQIAFGSKFGPLIYSTDSCEFWQHNVRSIALGLEALRAVDRYGATKRGEQYTGWKALGAEATPMPAESPMDVLARYAGQTGRGTAPAQMWRIAKRRTHPDADGGSREAWDAVQAAARALGLT